MLWNIEACLIDFISFQVEKFIVEIIFTTFLVKLLFYKSVLLVFSLDPCRDKNDKCSTKITNCKNVSALFEWMTENCKRTCGWCRKYMYQYIGILL